MESTLHALCPKCKERALVEHVRGTYACAACAFDYGTLASDERAREQWMVENMKLGPWGQLVVIELHRRITAQPPAASNAKVIAIAKKHGIELPTGKPTSPALLAALFLIGTVLFGLAIAYAVTR